MNSKMIAPIMFGLMGVAILVSLGVWQLHRLEWKESKLAQIEQKIVGIPGPVPAEPLIDDDLYRPVEVSGQLGAEEIHVLVSHRLLGPGYRIITSIDTGKRRLLLDRGFVPDGSESAPRPAHHATVTGNLHWPDERTGSTPDNDTTHNVWFARDIPDLAAALGTEPVLIVARSDTGDGITPLPVNTEGIPNDHLQYAITWFSLAAVWFGMTVYFLWRMKRRAS